jgi:4-carboxymuconolactone decarboxylase
MSREPSAAEKMIGDFAPKLVDLTDRVLFGEVWESQELSKRDRSLVTVAALIALNRPEQLRFHLDKALENGLKKEELIEVITHLAFYSGWPNAMSAIMIAKQVLSQLSYTPAGVFQRRRGVIGTGVGTGRLCTEALYTKVGLFKIGRSMRRATVSWTVLHLWCASPNRY